MVEATELKINPNPFWGFMNRFEHGLGFVLLMLLTLIPVIEAILRSVFFTAIPYAQNFLDNLIIPLTFVGIALTTKEGRHLSINIGLKDRKDSFGEFVRLFIDFVSGLIIGLYFFNSLEYVLLGFSSEEKLYGLIPVIAFMLSLPLCMFIVTWRMVPKKRGKLAIAVYFIGIAFSTIFGMASIAAVLQEVASIPASSFGLEFFDGSWWQDMMTVVRIPAVIILLIAGVVGAPLFLVLGGISVFLFGADGFTFTGALSDSISNLKTSSTPAIALFTFTGYLLSESQASKRLIALFQGFLGRLPGGMIIVVVLVSAFFTSFTGASGITILALGAMLFAILKDSGKNSESLSIGLISSSGAIGLMFPPSLAIIIYGAIQMSSVASAGGVPANILQLFLAGILPGLLFVGGMIGLGVFLSRREHKGIHWEKPAKWTRQEMFVALKASALELLLPVIILTVYFAGWAGIVETAAFAVVYTLIIEVFVKREIGLKKLIEIAVYTLIIYGGIMAILTFVKGLSYYFVISQFDIALVAWAQETIQSPLLFLLLLNVLLLIVGCFMDIFSAIVIFVPLVTGIATVFGINQAHLAIIFLSNLSVGFITPPVGMDLFLSSYRFNRPMVKIYKDVWPFVLLQIGIVFLITYVPWFSMAFL